jgi:hypothetical protein
MILAANGVYGHFYNVPSCCLSLRAFLPKNVTTGLLELQCDGVPAHTSHFRGDIQVPIILYDRLAFETKIFSPIGSNTIRGEEAVLKYTTNKGIRLFAIINRLFF